MLREMYSGLGAGAWTWAGVSANPAEFRAWLLVNQGHIGGWLRQPPKARKRQG